MCMYLCVKGVYLDGIFFSAENVNFSKYTLLIKNSTRFCWYPLRFQVHDTASQLPNTLPRESKKTAVEVLIVEKHAKTLEQECVCV